MKSKGADYAVESVHNLAQVIPEIWANEMDGGDPTMTRSKSELEAVLACALVGAWKLTLYKNVHSQPTQLSMQLKIIVQ